MNQAAAKPVPDAAGNGRPLLAIRGLKTHFPIYRGLFSRVVGHVRAVDGIDLDIHRGQTLGLVGESGCGKTTAGRSILRLVRPTAGSVLFDGTDILTLGGRKLRTIRRYLQMIFQDPVGSLNPRMSVASIVGEPLEIHRLARGRRLRERVGELLARVGLDPEDMNRYPHEFSGGQRQRIGIARAIALNPRLIVCDEPVSALDVSIQSQILNLLADLRDEFHLSYLFIAHNLSVVRHFCNEVCVMYLGKIVEIAPVDQLYESPRHPYTQALLASAPQADPSARSDRVVLSGEVPSPADPPSGCAFHPRCPFATEHCRLATPHLTTKQGLSPDHMVACHHADEVLSWSDIPRRKPQV